MSSNLPDVALVTRLAVAMQGGELKIAENAFLDIFGILTAALEINGFAYLTDDKSEPPSSGRRQFWLSKQGSLCDPASGASLRLLVHMRIQSEEVQASCWQILAELYPSASATAGKAPECICLATLRNEGWSISAPDVLSLSERHRKTQSMPERIFVGEGLADFARRYSELVSESLSA